MILIYCFQRFFYVNNPDRFNRKKVDESDFMPGDVILTSFENISKMISNSFFRIEFMHPSLVVEENGKKYIIELMNYSNKKGFHMMRLGEWINRNKNNLFLLNKLSTDIDREEISRRIISYSYKYSQGSEKIKSVGGLGKKRMEKICNAVKKGYIEQDIKNDKTLCNEFIVFLLIKSDIVLPTKSIDHYDPDQFIGMKGFDLNKSYMYKEHFLCDISNFFS